jgi:hypothetical protein
MITKNYSDITAHKIDDIVIKIDKKIHFIFALPPLINDKHTVQSLLNNGKHQQK